MEKNLRYFKFLYPVVDKLRFPILSLNESEQKELSVPKTKLIPNISIKSLQFLQFLKNLEYKSNINNTSNKKKDKVNLMKFIQPTDPSGNRVNIQDPPKFLDNQSLTDISTFQKWDNKLIQGDSLKGMAKLIDDGFKSKVQMVYMDPPFGIQYKAKFLSGNQSSEGYLDKWKNSLHSYLQYLKERFLLIRELLTSSGSIFVQIGEENIHYVRCLLDEIFGTENYMNLITFRTAISTNRISNVADYLIWYAKDKSKVLYHRLFKERSLEKKMKTFTYHYINPKSGEKEPFKPQELVKRISSSTKTKKYRNFPIIFQDKEFYPPSNFEWRWDKNAINRLIELNRITVINEKLYGMRFEKDFPAMLMTNIWTDTSTSTFAAKKHYTVHTNPKVIKRCISMTTNPGDIVLDPTLGSGTTAIVAEDLSRRWIGFDTSPTAILSTINWLLGKNFPIYKWDNKCKNFEYHEISKVSLSNLAHDRPSKSNPWYGKPKIKKKKGRVCSPFTISNIHEIYNPNSEKMNNSNFMLDKIRFYKYILTQNGIYLPDGESLIFSNIIHKEENNYYTIDDLVINFTAFIDKTLINISIFLNPDVSFVKKFVNNLENYCKKISASTILLFESLSIGLINSLINIQNKLHTFTEYIINWGILHPDLKITHLDFAKHPEALKILGRCNFDNRDIEFGFTHPISRKFIEIDNNFIAAWMIIEKPELLAQLWTTLGRCIFIQIPFYKKYMDSEFMKIWGNTPIDFPYIELLKDYMKVSPSPIFHIIDNRGTSFFGQFIS